MHPLLNTEGSCTDSSLTRHFIFFYEQEGQKLLEKAVSLDPNSGNYHANLGKYLFIQCQVTVVHCNSYNGCLKTLCGSNLYPIHSSYPGHTLG